MFLAHMVRLDLNLHAAQSVKLREKLLRFADFLKIVPFGFQCLGSMLQVALEEYHLEGLPNIYALTPICASVGSAAIMTGATLDWEHRFHDYFITASLSKDRRSTLTRSARASRQLSLAEGACRSEVPLSLD